MSKEKPEYILITPVRDEEKYISQTLDSVVAQTITPSRWIIVDDGSIDKTPEIISEYSCRFPWIQVLRIERNSERQPGSPVIKAFNRGYELVRNTEFDYIAKFDGDLSLAPDYFERLIERFIEEPHLGIGSGIYLEDHGRGWNPVKMPYYHTAGACKFIRRKCFEQIGGFVAAKGWDTVDEIRAQMNGWKTRHFENLHMYHLKNEGTGIGFLKTNAMHGEIFYVTGGGHLFFMLKVVHRIFTGRPVLLGGLMLLYGYIKALVQNRKRLVSVDEAKFYSSKLNSRIIGRKEA